jgi:hypothetical protein
VRFLERSHVSASDQDGAKCLTFAGQWDGERGTVIELDRQFLVGALLWGVLVRQQLMHRCPAADRHSPALPLASLPAGFGGQSPFP